MNWICPICHTKLTQSSKSWLCENRHCFDIARQSYVNLHTVQSKRSKSPGDSREMIESRRRFLSKGYYSSLERALVEMTQHWIDQKHLGGSVCSMLDIGCGEGHFTHKVVSSLKQPFPLTMSGVDISKEAIKQAAQKYGKEIEFVVASNYHIPVLTSSCDLIFQLFAPADDGELARILKPDGALIRVTPGPLHLKELRERLYKQHVDHSEEVSAPKGFKSEIATPVRVMESVLLEGASSIGDLVHMTPYNWRGSESAKESLLNLDSLTVTVDFQISVWDQ